MRRIVFCIATGVSIIGAVLLGRSGADRTSVGQHRARPMDSAAIDPDVVSAPATAPAPAMAPGAKRMAAQLALKMNGVGSLGVPRTALANASGALRGAGDEEGASDPQLDAARARFLVGHRDLAQSREFDARLRSELDTYGIDRRGLNDVECRDNLCRAELYLRDTDVLKASALADEADMSIQGMDLRRGDRGELQVIAYITPR